jgi:hypothetical protein
MSQNDVLDARLDVLALAVDCIAASLPATQAREVAAGFGQRLSLLLAERRQFSADADAAVAYQVGLLMQALKR